MAPGYYWARQRALAIEGWEIVLIEEWGDVWSFRWADPQTASEWDFGPRVKGQDADYET